MAKVQIIGAIGYCEEASARFIDLSAVSTTQDRPANPIKPTIPDDKLGQMPWSPWGANNLLPMEMVEDIDQTPILNSIIDMMMRFGVCEGPVPVITRLDETTGQRVIVKYVNDQEILDFLENNNLYFQSQCWIKDLLGLGNMVGRYGLNRKKTPSIISIQRDDVVEFRYAKKNSKGIIDKIYLAAEWNRVRAADDPKLLSVFHLNPYNMVGDLEKRVAGGAGTEYAFTARYPSWNKHYYSMPLWYAAMKWVKIAQGVPEMKAAIFENFMHVKYQVIIHDSYWLRAFGPTWKKYTEDQRKDKRQKVFDDIGKFLIGAKNASKTIITQGYKDKDGKLWTDIEIKDIPDNDKDGKLLPDSAAANSEIAFAMHFNNSLLGGNQKDGPYQGERGGSSVREAGLMQVTLLELERQNIRRALHVPKIFNGWAKKHPGLDFIIPATVLTTLDTGAGTKPILPGGTKPDEGTKPPANE
jgi:hypothetical protein